MRGRIKEGRGGELKRRKGWGAQEEGGAGRM